MSRNRLVGLLIVLALAVSASIAGGEVIAVDTDGLVRLVERERQSVFLLDVRTPGEFAAGRVPGALLIPINEVHRRLGEIPRDRKIIVMCASGVRSAAVARYLDEMGYRWVANYTGGVMDYASRGLPLER